MMDWYGCLKKLMKDEFFLLNDSFLILCHSLGLVLQFLQPSPPRRRPETWRRRPQRFSFFGGYHPLTKFTFSDFEDLGTSKSYRDINVEGTITSLGFSYRTQYLNYNIEYTKTKVSKISHYANNKFRSNTYPNSKNSTDLNCDSFVIDHPSWNTILLSIGIPFYI